MRMTSCTGGFEKKSVSWVLRFEEEGWLSLAHSGLVAGATRVVGGRWKSQQRKNVYLSPYVEEPFKLKGNKKVSYLN